MPEQVKVETKAGGEYTGRLGGRRNLRVVKSVTQELGCLSLNAGSTTGYVILGKSLVLKDSVLSIAWLTTGAKATLPAFQSWLQHFLTV